MSEFIAIEGNIGAGKTSLVHLLQRERNGIMLLEEFETNPFLEDFYRDPQKYALSLELHFLYERVQQMQALFAEKNGHSDGIWSDYHIDKCLIYAAINLGEEDFDHYEKRFMQITADLPRPEKLVYLNNSTDQLLKNILKRGRSYEQEIKLSYLEEIGRRYLDYLQQIHEFPVIYVHTSKLDFVRYTRDYQKLSGLVQNRFRNGFNEISF